MEQQQATQSNSARLHALRYKDYGFPSHTSIQQGVTENRVAPFFTDAKLDSEKRASLQLLRNRHKKYLSDGLRRLSCYHECLDASRPWLVYWICSALDLLGELPDPAAAAAASEQASADRAASSVQDCDADASAEIEIEGTPSVSPSILLEGDVVLDAELMSRVVRFLARCANSDRSRPPPAAVRYPNAERYDLNYEKWSVAGGFGGGPGQLSHLAPTYASVNALMCVGTQEAFESIDRLGIYSFLMSVKHSSGGFRMHVNGEVDIRASYCAVAVASVLNIATPALLDKVADFIVACQSYEGGIGGEPGNEAHGGNTFCGLAAAMIVGCEHQLDLHSLLRWVLDCHMPFEGGFQGRTNKLVDACYSFWQGATIPMLQEALGINTAEYIANARTSAFDYSAEFGKFFLDEDFDDAGLLYNQRALQDYVLLCCQQPDGGIRDKPSKSRDYYHSCYGLAGLAIAQHNPIDSASFSSDSAAGPEQRSPFVCVGPPSNNLLQRLDPRYGVRQDKVLVAKQYFARLPLPE